MNTPEPHQGGDVASGKDIIKAERYYKKAIALDPKFVAAYEELATMASLQEDKEGLRVYWNKIAELKPNDPQPQFLYIATLADLDPVAFRAEALELAKRFPGNEVSAIALSTLASYTGDSTERIALLERVICEFPPEKFREGNLAAYELLKQYDRRDPRKALSFAEEMMRRAVHVPGMADSKERSWPARVANQRLLIQARAALADGRFAEALAALEKITPGMYPDVFYVSLFKTEARSGAGR